MENIEIHNQIKYCNKCGKNKTLEEFYKCKSKKDGYQSNCKECKRLSNKDYKIKNRDKIKKVAKKYREKHPHRGVGQYSKYKEKRIIYGANRRIKVKLEVLTHYGNGKCACVKCGFSNAIALTIDHINGDGAIHRKENRYVRGNHVYEWLKKNNFPLGYQTLCMNCQFIKRSENNESNYGKIKKLKKTLDNIKKV